MKRLPATRSVIAIMIFSACAISYMLRVNMSINIIAMVDENKELNTTFVPECVAKHVVNQSDSDTPIFVPLPNYGRRYQWDSKTQGIILGAYFWGQTISCAPGGLIAEKFGPTKTVLGSTVFAAAFTLLIPFTASWHYAATVLLRFMIGLMCGVTYPSLHCLISRWAPPEEKGIFIGALLGGSLGTVITWPLLGTIIESWGWTWGFFVPGAVALLWCILWMFSVTDSPAEHKRISEKEKAYIENSLKGAITKQKGLPPYKDIITSIPVWAFIILHFGNSWGLFFLMTAGPKFMSSVLGFNIGSSGFLSALPYLARMALGFVFGYIGDILIKRKSFTTTTIRRSFVLFSHIIPGIFLILITTTNCDVAWTIVLITMSLGINGASTITNLSNSQDLAPNYAGTLYGIANTIGGTTGFITPFIAGYITQYHNGINEWRIIFCIGASVYIVCGLVFCFFGSGENQPWNFEKEESTSKEKNGSMKQGIDNTAYQKTEPEPNVDTKC